MRTKIMMTTIKTYSELMEIRSFRERYRYLKLDGIVGQETFGYDRYLNQILYNSGEWRRFRRDIIIRDKGNDLACDGYEIGGIIIVHHINPITIDDVLQRAPMIFDPENVISCSDNTHKAVHYGDESRLVDNFITRTKNDTCPWRRD